MPPVTLEPRVITLAGQSFVLRLLHADDLQRLRDFFYSHTPETIHARYGYMIKDMTPERATQLVCVDQTRDLALGIFESTPREEVLHAVGRYCLDPDTNCAEAAFVVRETLRNAGMASCLLKALIDTARARGLAYIWASTAPDNHAMLHLLKKARFKLDKHLTDGTIMMKLTLDREAAPRRKPRTQKKSGK